MDDKLFSRVYKDTPKFNPVIANNICAEIMQNVEDVIVDRINSVKQDFPDKLKFVRLERVDPKTEYANSWWYKKEHDIAENTLYMVQLIFEFDGKPLKPFYMYLPYCRKGGIMSIGGSDFALHPVLIDPCISVTDKNLYLSVNKNKLTFNQLEYQFVEDGDRKNTNLVWSRIYLGGAKKQGATYAGRRTRKMLPLLAHYLFTEHGLTGSFKRYLKVESVVAGFDDLINEDNYPSDTWVICQSTQVKPNTVKSKTYYPTKVKLAIKRDELDSKSRYLIGAFFYLADHFPERFAKMTSKDLDNYKFYQRLLALVILPYEPNEITAISDLHRHLDSSRHIDETLKRRLAAVEQIYAEDLFDLLAAIIVSYEKRIMVTIDRLTTMYDKRLVLLPYLLDDILQSITTLGFDMQSVKNDPNFTAQKAETKIGNRLRKVTIISINNSDHKETAPVSIATDNLLAKVSTPIIQQADMASSKNKKSGKRKIGYPDLLSASIAEVGSILSDAGCATGRSRLNMYVNVDNMGNIERNQDLKPIVDKAQSIIRR